jgi:hypothetical protein
LKGPTKVPVLAQLCPAAWHFATAFGLPWFPLMQAFTLMLQSAARAGKLSAIENATVATNTPDFHISFLQKIEGHQLGACAGHTCAARR